ncbi:MAG TPA: response regulator [Longimicrobiales bacterium]|nr:response regulator [Longimicrobiales bacterium]
MPPKKILVVDDHLDTRFICRELLTHFGYEVSEAIDGVQAYDVAVENPPHLILLDFLMPNSDGQQTLEKLRAHDGLKNTRIVLYTAAATQMEALRKLTGVERVLLKPLESRHLLQVVRELIGPAELAPPAV